LDFDNLLLLRRSWLQLFLFLSSGHLNFLDFFLGLALDISLLLSFHFLLHGFLDHSQMSINGQFDFGNSLAKVGLFHNLLDFYWMGFLLLNNFFLGDLSLLLWGFWDGLDNFLWSFGDLLWGLCDWFFKRLCGGSLGPPP
jgi:hypothetical protein